MFQRRSTNRSTFNGFHVFVGISSGSITRRYDLLWRFFRTGNGPIAETGLLEVLRVSANHVFDKKPPGTTPRSAQPHTQCKKGSGKIGIDFRPHAIGASPVPENGNTSDPKTAPKVNQQMNQQWTIFVYPLASEAVRLRRKSYSRWPFQNLYC
jgi:hypothetical protein